MSLNQPFIEIAPDVFISNIYNITTAYLHCCGSLIITTNDSKSEIVIQDEKKVKIAIKRLKEFSYSVIETKEKEKAYEDKNDFEEPEGLKVVITKSSSVDEWIWTVTVGEQEFIQTRSSYNWGNKVLPCSEFVVNILKEITKIQITSQGHHSSYAIGKNQIQCNYINELDYNSEFYTAEELYQYINKTVKAIKALIAETEKVESVTFNI
jgi:hypothetical protein